MREMQYFAYKHGFLVFCNRISSFSSVSDKDFWGSWSAEEILEMAEKLAQLYFQMRPLGDDENGKFVFPDRMDVTLPMSPSRLIQPHPEFEALMLIKV
jgi:hypothetical protein